jgi:hypothetical protein
VKKSLLLAIGMIVLSNCVSQSGNNGRQPSERVADVAVSASMSAATGISTTANGTERYKANLNTFIAGGFSCMGIQPTSVTVKVFDLSKNKEIVMAIPVQEGWRVNKDLNLYKGQYQIVIVSSKSSGKLRTSVRGGKRAERDAVAELQV